MAKKIKLSYEGTEYTLEYTRKSIERMEDSGFILNDIRNKPMSTFPTLFAGAFLAHHKWTKAEIIDAIFNELPNKETFMEKLIDMYSEPVEALFDEPEPSEKNAQWEANF